MALAVATQKHNDTQGHTHTHTDQIISIIPGGVLPASLSSSNAAAHNDATGTLKGNIITVPGGENKPICIHPIVSAHYQTSPVARA